MFEVRFGYQRSLFPNTGCRCLIGKNVRIPGELDIVSSIRCLIGKNTEKQLGDLSFFSRLFDLFVGVFIGFKIFAIG